MGFLRMYRVLLFLLLFTCGSAFSKNGDRVVRVHLINADKTIEVLNYYDIGGGKYQSILDDGSEMTINGKQIFHLYMFDRTFHQEYSAISNILGYTAMLAPGLVLLSTMGYHYTGGALIFKRLFEATALSTLGVLGVMIPTVSLIKLSKIKSVVQLELFLKIKKFKKFDIYIDKVQVSKLDLVPL